MHQNQLQLSCLQQLLPDPVYHISAHNFIFSFLDPSWYQRGKNTKPITYNSDLLLNTKHGKVHEAGCLALGIYEERKCTTVGTETRVPQPRKQTSYHKTHFDYGCHIYTRPPALFLSSSSHLDQLC